MDSDTYLAQTPFCVTWQNVCSLGYLLGFDAQFRVKGMFM